jgi:HemK-related putative methylase
VSTLQRALLYLCAPPERTLWRRLTGHAARWNYRCRRPGASRRAVLEQLEGRPLVVLPGVMNPRWMRTGAFLASCLSRELTCDRAVLDLGTGSGVCALAAGRHARRVLATDMSPVAVRCARINALLQGLEHVVDVIQGDLFTPARAERFDLVVFNPPFLQGEPRNDADRAWRSPDVAQRFASELGARLLPGGCALVILSSFGGAPEFIRQFRAARLQMSVHAQRQYPNETLTVLRLEAAAASGTQNGD